MHHSVAGSGLAALCLSAALGGSGQANAQGGSAAAFPQKAVRFIVPVPPGGGADFVARTYAKRLGDTLGQPFVIDNRGGAAGIIAMELVARAAPDGYTLIQTNVSTVSINPFIYRKLPYDAIADFAPVSLATLNPLVLVVHPAVPARTVPELAALARASPGKLGYASLGGGSIQHLAGHLFSKSLGLDITHVPYKGAAPATVDLLAGQVSMAFSGVGTVVGHAKAGRLRALALTGSERIDAFGDIPLMRDAGVDIPFLLWNGVLGPARTPAPVIRALNAAMVEASRSAEVRTALASQSTTPASNTPEAFARFIREEQARYSKVVRESGARAD
ncbi:MAG: Bug family tripartite tricarboxylate transporter substrate binding protein [bacterium]